MRVRLLTPLCKYFATEVCDDLTRDAMQVFGGIGFTMDADVGKLHADSLIMTIYEGTSEIQASFALREMGKGALAVVFQELRTELAALHADPARDALARRVDEVMVADRGIRQGALLGPRLRPAASEAAGRDGDRRDRELPSCSSRRARRRRGSGSPRRSSAGGCSKPSTWAGASSRTPRAAWRATSTCSSSWRPGGSEAASAAPGRQIERVSRHGLPHLRIERTRGLAEAASPCSATLLARRAIVPALIGLSALAGMLCLAHATRHGIGIAPDSVSYIEAARNLGAGHGISTLADEGAGYLPMTRFPPLYPVAIAAISRLGVDPVDAARALALALFGANIVLASALVARSAPGARWLPVVGAVLTASSPEVVAIHGAAQSEPLFLLLGFSGLLLLSVPSRETAHAHAGLGIAPDRTGVAHPIRRGIPGRDGIPRHPPRPACAAPPACVGRWRLRGRRHAPDGGLGASQPARRRVGDRPAASWSIRSARTAITLAIRSIGPWFLVDHGGEVIAWLLGMGLLLCIGHWLSSGAVRAGAAAMPRILLLFVFAYLGSSSSFRSPSSTRRRP